MLRHSDWRTTIETLTATPPTAALTELRGAPASPGQATGPARILRGPDQAARLRPGDILVCATLTPAWTPLFSSAVGIITENAGALSSPATIAREHGIPAVVAAKGATTRIRDGQTVIVDGATGVILLQD
ncbi:MAG: PEP-utilizing enzyme [Dehalococcoidia bacterium]